MKSLAKPRNYKTCETLRRVVEYERCEIRNSRPKWKKCREMKTSRPSW